MFLVDWNDFGIDERAASTVIHGTPEDWFAPHGWRVLGTHDGMEWGPVTRTVLEAVHGANPDRVPTAAWFRTRKGRGYGKLDAKSHGTPHPANSPEFWAVRREFMDAYGVAYEGVDAPLPDDAAARYAQAGANLRVAVSVLRRDPELVTWLSDRLVAVAAGVPDEIPGVTLGDAPSAAIFEDPRITDFRSYPAAMYKAPGEQVAQPGRAGHLGSVGQRVREARARPAAVRRRLGRPRRVHQHRGLRQGLR